MKNQTLLKKQSDLVMKNAENIILQMAHSQNNMNEKSELSKSALLSILQKLSDNMDICKNKAECIEKLQQNILQQIQK